jgi:cell division septation protein DedD
MTSGGNRGSAGERVLESRHVIGLFMAVIVLSGLFFTLGYVMGRNQVAGEVSADLREKPELPAVVKPDVILKKPNKSASAPAPAGTSTDTTAPGNSDWEFYHAGDNKKPLDGLKPAASAPAPASAKKTEPTLVKTTATSSRTSPGSAKSAGSASTKSAGGQAISGGYTLQVAALTKEADALDLARRLQQKKFPAYVLSAKTDKYYRVQVGPYSDPKAAEAARKGLEGAGFRAFVKPN